MIRKDRNSFKLAKWKVSFILNLIMKIMHISHTVLTDKVTPYVI